MLTIVCCGIKKIVLSLCMFNLKDKDMKTELEECIENGTHLVSCDDDGFCNECGHQESGDFMCNNCGGGFTREEMDFDVNDQDLCKNCNHQSFNDAPYGDEDDDCINCK